MRFDNDALHAALHPRSVAVVGASDNPDKVGGRPVDYLKRFGYRGNIYPVNPKREIVQGVRCYPDLRALPEVPDLAIIAVAGEQVPAAVQDCASCGVRSVIVLSSGFGETGEAGRAQQEAMTALARKSGMRLIGPNAQGLANFSNGAVANFSTMFTQVPPQDGPVAIVSQSGATSAALYTRLREAGVGVRYVLATGNESDVTVSELALRVLDDREVRLLILYVEGIRDADVLAEAARQAGAQDVPVIAIKAGRGVQGLAAAASHTGALVNEDGVVDAFFNRHGIARAADLPAAVDMARLLLKPGVGPGRRLAIVSNSGSSCVMCADLAEEFGLPLAGLAADTRQRIAQSLSSYAACANPVDLTSSLLGNADVFGQVLRAVGDDPEVDLCVVSLPVAGAGYALDRMAEDALRVEAATGKALAVTATLESALEPFRQRGLATFATERQAVAAFDAATRLRAGMRRRPPRLEAIATLALPAGASAFLSEADSLAILSKCGVPVVEHEVCETADAAVQAWRRMNGPVVLKACSALLPHKSEHGLVHLGLDGEAEVRAAFEKCRGDVAGLGLPWDGAVVARMEKGRREFAVGAKLDPIFGPVVMISDGGKYIEALPDFVLLLPPFDAHEAREAMLGGLRVAPLFAGVRGELAMDIDALADLAAAVGRAMMAGARSIVSMDLNPVIVRSAGQGVVVVDALIERRMAPGAPAATVCRNESKTEELRC